jgi:hypothetical protein
MKAMIAAMALALASGGEAAAATEPCEGGRPGDCRAIVAATKALTRMLVTSDPAPLRRYLDPRALWVTASGATRSGDDLIASVRRDTPRAAARLDHVRVRFFGDTAMVVWRESWTAPGASGALAGVDTWVRRRGKWRIVTTAEYRVPQ